MSYKILNKYGKPYNKSLYHIYVDDRTVYLQSAPISALILDFTNYNDYTFKLGHTQSLYCGNNCTIKIGTIGYTLIKPGENCKLISHIYFNDYELAKIVSNIKDNIFTIYSFDIKIEIKDKNDALLNLKHDDEFVRTCCEKILKGIHKF
jgi:hypothetical protein